MSGQEKEQIINVIKLKIQMELDALTFIVEITKGDIKNQVLIFKRIPGSFLCIIRFKGLIAKTIK